MSISRLKVLARIAESGLVAVVRAESSDEAARIAEACTAGGVGAIEITLTVPGALGVIEDLAARHDAGSLLIGAGTVLDAQTARMAMLAGAQFIVSPSLDANTGQLCNRYGIPWMPGAQTVRDVIAAMELGADIVKVFPGEVLGPGFIRAVKGPLPQACLMPTGGVTLENAGEWIKAGAVALGVGGNLTKGAKSGDFVSITNLARQFRERIQQARA
jgi:2-dehydro-3-deoxyphosphogluconate aldolase / (4S)-4-hydroxy-2-oxoglutarate aldolase